MWQIRRALAAVQAGDGELAAADRVSVFIFTDMHPRGLAVCGQWNLTSGGWEQAYLSERSSCVQAEPGPLAAAARSHSCLMVAAIVAQVLSTDPARLHHQKSMTAYWKTSALSGVR